VQQYTVTVRDPEGGSGHSQEGSFEGAVSRAIDAVVAAGGNAASVSSVAFMLSDTHAAEAEASAKRAAIADLQAVAALDAQALGVRLGTLAAFAPDAWASPRPVAADWATVDDAAADGGGASAAIASAKAAGGSVATPIVAGDISTGGEVYGTYYVCPE
jgi:type II secretory pathway pseudopilin PulG